MPATDHDLNRHASAPLILPTGWDECWCCTSCTAIGRGDDYVHVCLVYPLPEPVTPVTDAGSYLDLWKPKSDGFMTERRSRPRTRTPGARSHARARLLGVLKTLGDTTEGSRNATLHWSACRVAEMVVAGELPDPGAAADALADVAYSIGLDRSEVPGTIRSGFRENGVVV